MSPRRQFIVSSHLGSIPILCKCSQPTPEIGRLRLVDSSFAKIDGIGGERGFAVLTDVIQRQVKEDAVSFEEAIHLVAGADPQQSPSLRYGEFQARRLLGIGSR